MCPNVAISQRGQGVQGLVTDILLLTDCYECHMMVAILDPLQRIFKIYLLKT